MTDRRNDTSRALTEVRTVLSRAETALDYIEQDKASEGEEIITHWDFSVKPAVPTYGLYESDPDAEYMIAALRAVTAILEPWRGKNKSRGQRSREWWEARQAEREAS